MFDIEFYEDSSGNSDLESFISQLCDRSKTVKDARIAFTKTVAYLNILQEKGTAAGLPVLRHIQNEIWELRPLSYRILFAKVPCNIFHSSRRCHLPKAVALRSAIVWRLLTFVLVHSL